MSHNDLAAQVDTYVDEVWEDVIKDINTLVGFESVEDLAHKELHKPWGPQVAAALDSALSIAERLGLEPHNLDGYIGYAELKGEKPSVIATIAHADIVPLGSGWTTDPLSVTRRDGFILGRGVLDDKGPLVLSLYAHAFFARMVNKTGKKLPYTLHAIAGANEETGMGDVDHYLDACGEPVFCFTPDADFPLICGEKGILHGSFTSHAINPRTRTVIHIEGGTVVNAIPGEAFADVRANYESLAARDNIDIYNKGEGICRLVAHGKGGHASLPAGTVNAIGLLVDYLLSELNLTEPERTWFELVSLLTRVSDGTGVGIASQDDKFGPLTAIGGVIATDGDCFTQSIDSRYPTSTTGETIHATLDTLASAHNATYTQISDAKPFYIEPDSEDIQALLRTYAAYTGYEPKPVVIGGGTYARHFKRACAFGPNDPYLKLPEWIGMEHGPDEGIAEDTLKTALKIYIVSIARLMELELA